MSTGMSAGAGVGRERRGTLHIDLLGGKGIWHAEGERACLYVKIRVGSDTSWTDQPAHSFSTPVFGKRFTGFNVRSSTVVEFHVVNKTRTSDVPVDKGTYPVMLLSPCREVVFVPLRRGGYLEVEMAYTINEEVPLARPPPSPPPLAPTPPLPRAYAAPVSVPVGGRAGPVQLQPATAAGMQGVQSFHAVSTSGSIYQGCPMGPVQSPPPPPRPLAVPMVVQQAPVVPAPLYPTVTPPVPPGVYPQYYPYVAYPQQQQQQQQQQPQQPQQPQLVPGFASPYAAYSPSLPPIRYPKF